VENASDNPAVYISWNDAQDFVYKLNPHISGKRFQLPTEAE